MTKNEERALREKTEDRQEQVDATDERGADSGDGRTPLNYYQRRGIRKIAAAKAWWTRKGER